MSTSGPSIKVEGFTPEQQEMFHPLLMRLLTKNPDRKISLSQAHATLEQINEKEIKSGVITAEQLKSQFKSYALGYQNVVKAMNEKNTQLEALKQQRTFLQGQISDGFARMGAARQNATQSVIDSGVLNKVSVNTPRKK